MTHAEPGCAQNAADRSNGEPDELDHVLHDSAGHGSGPTRHYGDTRSAAALKSVIVPTDVAVAFLVREGVTEPAARQWIYAQSHLGALPNHGKPGAKQARWDLAEIAALMWPKSPLPSSRKSA